MSKLKNQNNTWLEKCEIIKNENGLLIMNLFYSMVLTYYSINTTERMRFYE